MFTSVFSFWVCLWLFISQVPGWVIQLLAAPLVSPSPAFRGGFYFDWEDGTSCSPLGGIFQYSGKLCVFPLPLHHPSWSVSSYFQKCVAFLKKDFIYSFLERGEGKAKERERNINAWLPSVPPTGDLAHNPSMCHDWELNWRPFGSQPMLKPLSYTSQVNTV